MQILNDLRTHELINCLPVNSILIKHGGNGIVVHFKFYLSDYEFDIENHFTSQWEDEHFRAFIKRTLKELLDREVFLNNDNEVHRNLANFQYT